MKFLKMTVEKKHAWALRIIFLLAAFYFLHDIYYAFSSGTVAGKGDIIELSINPSGFYSAIFKKSAFAFVFLVFTFYSVKSKPDSDKENELSLKDD